MNSDDKNVDKQIKPYLDALDQAVDSMDKETQLHLDDARRKALDAIEKKSHRQWSFSWTQATMVAATLAVAIVVWAPKDSNVLHPEDMELLTSDAELEMYGDIEFAAWLDMEANQNAG